MEIRIVLIYLIKIILDIFRCLVDIRKGRQEQIKVFITSLICPLQLEAGLDRNHHISGTILFSDRCIHFSKQCRIVFVNTYNNKIIDRSVVHCYRYRLANRVFVSKIILCHRIRNNADSFLPQIVCPGKITSRLHLKLHILELFWCHAIHTDIGIIVGIRLILDLPASKIILGSDTLNFIRILRNQFIDHLL